jgi:hypothetical protein
MERIALRSATLGFAAGLAMFGFYVGVVRFASGSGAHLRDQLRADWYLVAAVTVAFAVQVALFVELRRRHRLHAGSMAVAGSAMGTSTAGMIACCAHHLADLAPFLGLAGAATFLYDYRLLFVGVGLGTNVAAITLSVRTLRRMPSHPRDNDKESACVAA